MQKGKTTNTKIGSAALIVMISIVASRLTGFIRETLVPNFIGFDKYADSYIIAFKITGLMYDLLVGGAIAAALIPVLSGYITKNQEKEGWSHISTFINSIFLLMIIACGLGMIFAPLLVGIIAPGFTDPEQIALTVSLVRILFPSVALLMLTGLTNGVLNSYRRFIASAFGPSIYNIGCSISIIIFGRQGTDIRNIAYGIVLTSFFYLLLQLFFVYPNLKYYRFILNIKQPEYIRLIKLAIPSLISSSIVQVNILIISSFATSLGTGTVNAYNVADRTWQMPYGIFAQGLGIAMLPSISAMMALGEIDKFKHTISRAIKFLSFVILPFCIIFILAGDNVISTLFKFTNKFGNAEVALTASILAFFSIAMISQSVVAVLNRAFYASNDTKTPLYTGLSTVVVILALCLIFTRMTNLDASGLAFSYTVASSVNALLLYYLLVKKIGALKANFRIFSIKTALASVVISIFLYFANAIFDPATSSKLSQFVLLFALTSTTFGIYFVVCLLLKLEEALYLKNILVSKIPRRLLNIK